MKRGLIVIVAAALPWPVFATEKASVTLENGGAVAAGGAARQKEVRIKMSKGIGKNEVGVDEQIVALRQQLEFLKLAKKHGVDPAKKVDLVCKERPLAEMLRELLPGVAVRFDGVAEGVTVESLSASQAPVRQVVEYLDDAAGVYFAFSGEGIAVMEKPLTE